ncbi:TerB family tellurite resistance protein [Halioglobus pacificus]|uniref:Co-chaperone DjlA N-terminal domain-containing protein n=1 Tax=Parahalioglobus pacificus TaxID=930806 RepID=A0A918XDC3_9GAMM|nr:TerB family tellurite resistance protein [Halioglobus pacificus]GHD27432.1 hypothetical protein GCM10007053_05700 [Halioglobus pacificus]
MIKSLLSLFELPEAASPEDASQATQLAAAALLIETARADFHRDEAEEVALRSLLADTLQLSKAQVEELVTLANQRADEATSLYEFTRVINDHYTPAQKLALIDLMWKVAYADSNLDKYEEHLIRRVAELTYVPHQDYIRSKLAAAP